MLPTLERTPAVLGALLRDLPDDAVRSAYGPGTWCAYEVVGHLIAGERLDLMPRIRHVLAHGTSRPFEPFPHDATIRADCGTPLADLLDEFATLRADGLRELRALRLSPTDLARRAVHPALGEVTLSQLLATWAAHDLHHVRQACLALAWRLREDVGPWRAYLNTFQHGRA
ncbi:MAG: DinB family protein [Planctomycetota bacterium]|nr:DinB family protein [Planctomycetota bacterium]